MGRIKTRESVKDIKILDKAAVASERMKTALVRSKDQAENLMDDGQISPSEYAEDKIRYAAEDVTDQVWHEVSGQTKKAIEKGKEAHREHRNEKRIHKNEERVRRYEEELRRGAPSRTPREEAARQAARQNTEATRTSIRSRRNQTIKSAERTERTIKQSARSAGKQTVKAGAKGTVKSTERTVKTAEKTSKAAIKTAEATAKATQKAAAAAAKAAQKAAEIARQTAIAAYKAAVAAAKAVAAAIKAIAAGMKALVAAIAAGGWVVVVVVVVICLVALIACSCFGIFFSSEDTGSEKTMRQVIQEINLDYQNELDAIKDSVEYDALEMSGSRAVWPEVLSIYAVKTTSDPDDPQEVATITPEKEQLLKDLFWEMNEITHWTETKTETVIVETVVLLSHKKADSYIHIDVEFGEGEGKIPVDSIAKRAEAYKPKEKVTYKMIKEYIEAKYGFKVHTAYIAEVKRNLGLPMYDAPNAVEELKQPRKHPTPEKVEAIKDALRYFAVI